MAFEFGTTVQKGREAPTVATPGACSEEREKMLTIANCSQVVLSDGALQMDEFQKSGSVAATSSTEVDVEVNDEVNVEDRVSGACASYVERLETSVENVYKRYRAQISFCINSVLLLAYLGYFSYCIYYRFGDEGSIVMLAGTVLFLAIKGKPLLCSRRCHDSVSRPCIGFISTKWDRRIMTYTRYGLYLIAFSGLAVYFGIDILTEGPRNAQSILGIFSFIVISFILSTKPSRVDWHPVFWGFVLQFLFAIFTLRTKFGYAVFERLGDLVNQLVRFSDIGGAFVLGKNFKQMGLGFVLAAVIIFFNSIIFLMIHWGVLEAIVVNFGRVMSYCLNTGPVESVIAVANIFIGSSEAPLLIKTYLPTLSKSEICAVMTCGFASISGSAMAMFISFGAPPNHLLTAAVISAPAALAFAKLICPETQNVNLNNQKDIKMTDQSSSKRNALSAAAAGASAGVKIVVGAMANMLAFVCILRLMDTILDWFGQRAGIEGLSFTRVCSYLFYPLAYVMGSDPADSGRLASLIGVKLFATPMVAYTQLGKMIKNRHIFEDYISKDNSSTWHWSGDNVILDNINMTLINGFMSERSEVIATYAMCGFSAFTAIGITLGTLSAMCPSRKDDIIGMVLRAFFAGNVASFATGAVAGLLYTENVQMLGK